MAPLCGSWHSRVGDSACILAQPGLNNPNLGARLGKPRVLTRTLRLLRVGRGQGPLPPTPGTWLVGPGGPSSSANLACIQILPESRHVYRGLQSPAACRSPGNPGDVTEEISSPGLARCKELQVTATVGVRLPSGDSWGAETLSLWDSAQRDSHFRPWSLVHCAWMGCFLRNL